jgi:hypothetical protein
VPESLAASGKNFTGAYAILNVGHWLTWTRKITEHTADRDYFIYEYTYEGIKSYEEIKHQEHLRGYYIIGLEALDRENEWWYNKNENEEGGILYYKPKEGVDPVALNLKAGDQDFAVNIVGYSNVSIQGIDFFATGFNIRSSNYIEFIDCKFEYPSENKFVLGIFDWFDNAFIDGIYKYSPRH